LPHLTQINTDVDNVIAIATGSISYIRIPSIEPQWLCYWPADTFVYKLF
jgi:hypothetical protein